MYKNVREIACATFLSNSEYEDNEPIQYISRTGYEKFYEMKKRKQIDVCGYVDI